jgi:hypothetical protein
MNAENSTASRKAEESGILRFDGSSIAYASQHYGSFSVPLSQIAVIGEFTTQDGPFVDDWFLVIVPRGACDWLEASMYAEGVDQLIEGLSTALDCSIHGQLAASTDFNSRIMWPISLSGCPIFTFKPVTGTGIIRRVRLAMRPETSHSLSLEALRSASDQ